MPSNPSTRLRLEKQAAGEHANTWGVVLNTDLDLLEAAIAGRVALTVSGPVTLTSSNYVADQARAAFLDCTGTGGTITIPTVEKLYLIRNATSPAADIVVTTGGATNATIKGGNTQWVVTDASAVYLVRERDLGADLLSTTSDPTTANHLARKSYVDAGDATNAAAITSGDAATLASSKSYTDATAFASGSLPGGGTTGQVLRRIAGPSADWHTIDVNDFNAATPTQSGNANKFLQTDGSTASWVSVAGAGAILFGDGSDGNVTINSGTTTLSRDMYYNSLTLSGTGVLNPNGWRIFVKGTLDLSAAPAGAIALNGSAGANAVAAPGTTQNIAAGGAGTNTNSVGGGGAGGAGGGGNTSNGTAATGGGGGAGTAGGASGGNGQAGASGQGSGQSAGAGNSPATIPAYVLRRPWTSLLNAEYGSSTLLTGGAGGAGGTTGRGGIGAIYGASGGAGGGGGGVVQIEARFVNRGASTAVAAIQVKGANGGNAVNAYDSTSGAGAGGCGGGGGWVYIVCEQLIGATATNAVDVSAGSGGAGGSSVSNATYSGGGGGYGGSGRLTVMQLTPGTYSDTGAGTSGAGQASATTAGSAGGVAPTTRYSL